MNDNFDPEDVLVLSGMTGLHGEALYYKPTTVARILHAASLPSTPLPDEIQGDPEKIYAYFMARVAKIVDGENKEPMYGVAGVAGGHCE